MALRLQSSVHGKIRRLLMSQGSFDTHHLFQAILLQIFLKRSKHTQIIVWCNSHEQRQDLSDDLLKIKPDINISFDVNEPDSNTLLLLSVDAHDTYTDTNSWARDPFLVFKHQGINVTAIKVLNDGNHLNSPIARYLADKGLLGLLNGEPWLKFAGGDVMFDGTYLYVGQETYGYSVEICGSYTEKCKKEVLSKLAVLFNLPMENIILIPDDDKLEQDEISYLFDRKKWFYTDEILGRKSRSFIDAMAIDARLAHIDLFFTPTGVISIESDKRPIVFLAKLVNLSVQNDHIDGLNIILDKIEKSLETKLVVKRNYLPCVESDDGYAYLYYNNCLVEHTGNENKVWLPCYSCSSSIQNSDKAQIKKYQDCNEKQWNAIGFKVEWIEADFIPFARKHLLGGLHCMTNELMRTN